MLSCFRLPGKLLHNTLCDRASYHSLFESLLSHLDESLLGEVTDMKLFAPEELDDLTPLRYSDPGLMKCPHCHSVGTLKEHSVASRYLYNSVDDIHNNRHILVQDYRCSHCGRYHRFHDGSICPFRSYTYPFMIEILHAYYSGAQNKSRCCALFGISRKVLNGIIRLFPQEEQTIAIVSTQFKELQLRQDCKDLVAQLRKNSALLIWFLYLFACLMGYPFACSKHFSTSKGSNSKRMYKFGFLVSPSSKKDNFPKEPPSVS